VHLGPAERRRRSPPGSGRTLSAGRPTPALTPLRLPEVGAQAARRSAHSWKKWTRAPPRRRNVYRAECSTVPACDRVRPVANCPPPEWLALVVGKTPDAGALMRAFVTHRRITTLRSVAPDSAVPAAAPATDAMYKTADREPCRICDYNPDATLSWLPQNLRVPHLSSPLILNILVLTVQGR